MNFCVHILIGDLQSKAGDSAEGSFCLPLLTTTPVMMDEVDPLACNGGGSVAVLRDNGLEFIKMGVDGLLPIFPQEAVAGRAELSSSLSFSLSSFEDLSPGAGQSDREVEDG